MANYAYGVVKTFTLCKLIDGSFRENIETTGMDFFSREDLPEPTRVCAEGQYQGMIFTLTVLGGDWVRDAKGKHRVFLMGESSRDTDEYTNKED